MFNRNLILKLLEAKGWTKYKLAKESGIPQSSLHDILSGKIKNPTGERLKSIADALALKGIRFDLISTEIEGMTLEQIASYVEVPYDTLFQLSNL